MIEHSVGRLSSFRILRAVALGLSLLAARDVSASCLPPASSLIGWWTGDGSANDSQSTNHGILQGGATATNAGLSRLPPAERVTTPISSTVSTVLKV